MSILKKICTADQWDSNYENLQKMFSCDDFFKPYVDVPKHVGAAMKHVLQYFIECGHIVSGKDNCVIKNFVVAFANPAVDPVDQRIVDVINIINACHYMNVFELAVTKYYLLIFVRIVPSKRTDAVGLRRILCFLHSVTANYVGNHHIEWSDDCDVLAPPSPSMIPKYELDYRGFLEVVDTDFFMAELGSQLGQVWTTLRKIVVRHADTPKYYIERVYKSNSHYDRAVIYS